MRQTVWIQIRTDVRSVLFLVQTVCKGYQQTTKITAGKERVNVGPKVSAYSYALQTAFHGEASSMKPDQIAS